MVFKSKIKNNCLFRLRPTTKFKFRISNEIAIIELYIVISLALLELAIKLRGRLAEKCQTVFRISPLFSLGLLNEKKTVSLRKDIIFQRAFPSTKASHFPFSTQTGSRSRRACQLDSAPIFYLGNRSKAVILKAALVRGSSTAEHDSTHLMALVAVK